MKKLCFLFLLAGSFVLAFGGPGYTAIESRPAPGAEQSEFAVPTVRFPHADLEGFTFQATHISPFNQGYKKVPGDGNRPEIKEPVSYSTLLPGPCSVINCLCAKKYLDHIYPSHNFW